MKYVFRFVIAFVVLVVAYAGLTPRQKYTSAKVQDFDIFVDTVIAERGIPGLSLAVIKGGTLVKLKGYGFANIKKEQPMTPDTPMNIASISKPILGIALLQLKDKGLLDLDADINDYLDFKVDNPNTDGEVITVRHLATHTSGIDDYYSPAESTANIDAPLLLVDYLKGLLTPEGKHYDNGGHYLDSRPGEKRLYSNLAAGVAGNIAENINGAPLRDMMAQSVFTPLGMTNTSWVLRDFAPGQLATRYDVSKCLPFTKICSDDYHPLARFIIGKVFNPKAKRNLYAAYPQFGHPNYPDGGVHASVKDLATLTQAILNKGVYEGYALLSPASFEEMLRLQLPPELSTRQRFFWRDNRNGMTGHKGSDLGVFTSLYFNMKTGNAVIILMNRTPDSGAMRAMEQVNERVHADYF
jgi:CubicO group peptidase (beta-lactamase class C family)